MKTPPWVQENFNELKVYSHFEKDLGRGRAGVARGAAAGRAAGRGRGAARNSRLKVRKNEEDLLYYKDN